MQLKFTDRFDITVDIKEAQKRFVNRAYNLVFYHFFYSLREDDHYHIQREIVSALGDKYSIHTNLADQIGDDFHRNLLALETFYRIIKISYHQRVNNFIKQILNESEVDIGVRWEGGRFIRAGAKLLDDKLVNDILHWLRNVNYKNVLLPFEKGLEHFLQSEKRPEILSDVITDMYESLEALSKIITNRPKKDLSSNRELFIAKVNASPSYKKLLAEYINYANEFRHAAEEGRTKPSLISTEVESFIYLTGVFIRLAIQ